MLYLLHQYVIFSCGYNASYWMMPFVVVGHGHHKHVICPTFHCVSNNIKICFIHFSLEYVLHHCSYIIDDVVVDSLVVASATTSLIASLQTWRHQAMMRPQPIQWSVKSGYILLHQRFHLCCGWCQCWYVHQLCRWEGLHRILTCIVVFVALIVKNILHHVFHTLVGRSFWGVR